MNAEKDIRVWLIRNDKRFIDIANATKQHRSSVSNWIKGRIAVNTKIEGYLREIGMPERLLKGREKCLRR